MADKVRSVRVADDLWRRAEEAAAREGVRVSAWIVRAMEAALDGGASAPVPPEPSPKRGPTTLAKRPPRAILAEAERSASHLGARAMEAAGVPFGNIRGPMQKVAGRAGQAGAHGRGPGPDRAR